MRNLKRLFGAAAALVAAFALPASAAEVRVLSVGSAEIAVKTLIPEFTKIFTSSHSKHVHEIVTASREGGASLTILSGLVAGNFSAFWKVRQCHMLLDMAPAMVSSVVISNILPPG